LTVIGEFVLTCKDRGRLTLSLVQAQRGYLIENTHLYSLRDLIDVSKNRFVPYLQSIIEVRTHQRARRVALCLLLKVVSVRR
jgi:hypothetical protein